MGLHALFLVALLVCRAVLSSDTQYLVFEGVNYQGKWFVVKRGDFNLDFNGTIGSVDGSRGLDSTVLLLYSEPNLQGQRFIVGERTYTNLTAFTTRSWEAVMSDSSYSIVDVYFTKPTKPYEFHSLPLQLKLNEAVNQVDQRPWSIVANLGSDYWSQWRPDRYLGEVIVLLYPKPFLQGSPIVLGSEQVPADVIIGSFQVLNRNGVNLWARGSSNQDAVITWVTNPGLPGTYLIELVHPGQHVEGREPGVIEALILPSGVVVESFFRPNFEWTARLFKTSVHGEVVGSFKVFKANDYKPQAREPYTVLLTEDSGFGPALGLRVNEQVYSIDFFIRRYPKGFLVIDVPPGFVLLGYLAIGFRDLEFMFEGFSLETIYGPHAALQSIRMVRQEDAPSTKPTEDPNKFFTCHGYKFFRRFPIDVPNPFVTKGTTCDRMGVPPGFALAVYDRPWWLGSPYIWTSSTETRLNFGPGNMRSYRVILANETTLYGGRPPPSNFSAEVGFFNKPGYTEPAFDPMTDSRIALPSNYTKTIAPLKGYVLETYADYNFQGTKALYTETKPFEIGLSPLFKSYKVYSIGQSSPNSVYAGFFINEGFVLFDILPIYLKEGESIDHLIFPWDGNVQRVTVPPSLVAVTYSEAQFGGRCRAWFNESTFGADWNTSVKSMSVVSVLNWTGCPKIPTLLPTPSPTRVLPTSLAPPDNMDTTPGDTKLPETTMTTNQFSEEITAQPSTGASVQSGNDLSSPTQGTVSTKPRGGTTNIPKKQVTQLPATKRIEVNGPSDDWKSSDTDGDTPTTIIHKTRSTLGNLWYWLLGVGTIALFVLIVGWRTRKPMPTTTTEMTSTDWQDLDMFCLDTPPFPLSHPLGSGATGSTYLATFEGQHVAVKVLHQNPSPTKTEVQAFIDEIQLLGCLNSPYIVTLVGVVWSDSTGIQAVLEYMNLGDLRQYLTKTSQETFSWPDKIKCVFNIAHALFFLHSQQMIHRDLKSRNVLLDSEKGAKLSDFGAAKQNVYVGETMTAAIGTFRWMAPEMLLYKGYTSAVDMYSFGVVLTELSTHALPYTNLEGVSDEAIVGRVLHEGLRPTFGVGCPKWLEMLGKRCMSANPDERPSASQVIHIVETNMSYTQSSRPSATNSTDAQDHQDRIIP